MRLRWPVYRVHDEYDEFVGLWFQWPLFRMPRRTMTQMGPTYDRMLLDRVAAPTLRNWTQQFFKPIEWHDHDPLIHSTPKRQPMRITFRRYGDGK